MKVEANEEERCAIGVEVSNQSPEVDVSADVGD